MHLDTLPTSATAILFVTTLSVLFIKHWLRTSKQLSEPKTSIALTEHAAQLKSALISVLPESILLPHNPSFKPSTQAH